MEKIRIIIKSKILKKSTKTLRIIVKYVIIYLNWLKASIKYLDRIIKPIISTVKIKNSGIVPISRRIARIWKGIRFIGNTKLKTWGQKSK